MFNRKSRTRTQPKSQSKPRLKRESRPRLNTSSPSRTGPGGGFHVRTRMARATGNAGRYACDAVRALPSMKRSEVILQATDGHQAVYVTAPGKLPAGQLVPKEVLPTKQLSDAVAVRLVDGKWTSSEGKAVADSSDSSEKVFPSLGDVLPCVGLRPHYETQSQANRRMAKTSSAGSSDGKAGKSATQRADDVTPASSHVVLGIDLDILRRTAAALGTNKLAIFIPVPVKAANTSASQTFVNKPVPVCPANNDKDGGDGKGGKEGKERGIGVVMPLTPTNANEYYEKLRRLVADSEQKESRRRSKAEA